MCRFRLGCIKKFRDIIRWLGLYYYKNITFLAAITASFVLVFCFLNLLQNLLGLSSLHIVNSINNRKNNIDTSSMLNIEY